VILGISITFAVVIGALFAGGTAGGEAGDRELLPAAIFFVAVDCAKPAMVPLALLERAMRFKIVGAVKQPRASFTRFCWPH